jgi:glyceraldehyde-3-phosphate dehydrogenase/erythrose-4-phosphate dehydrogenase
MISDAIQLVPGADGTTLVKVTSFYDNEMGYSHRMAELALMMTEAV